MLEQITIENLQKRFKEVVILALGMATVYLFISNRELQAEMTKRQDKTIEEERQSRKELQKYYLEQLNLKNEQDRLRAALEEQKGGSK